MLEFWKTSCEPLVGSMLTVHTNRGEAFVVDENNNDLTLDLTWESSEITPPLFQHGKWTGCTSTSYNMVLQLVNGNRLIPS